MAESTSERSMQRGATSCADPGADALGLVADTLDRALPSVGCEQRPHVGRTRGSAECRAIVQLRRYTDSIVVVKGRIEIYEFSVSEQLETGSSARAVRRPPRRKRKMKWVV